MTDKTKQEELTPSQKLDIAIDAIVSDLADLAVEWDDPTDYPMLEVDKASRLITNLALDYAAQEVKSVLEELEDGIAHTIMITNTQGNETIPDGQYIKVPNMLKAIQSIKEKYHV